MQRRNRQLAKAKWDAAVGNYSKYMRYGNDWRYPHLGFAPIGKRAHVSIIKHIECECEWRRMHRTRRSRRMLNTSNWRLPGRAGKRKIRDTKRHQICIKCGFSRLHPRYVRPLVPLPVVRESPDAPSCD